MTTFDLGCSTSSIELTEQSNWWGMPEFVQHNNEEYHMVEILINTEEDYAHFAKAIGQPLTDKSISIWHPRLKMGTRGRNINHRYIGEAVENRFPIYVVSKGRFDNRLTSDALVRMNIPHYIVVREEEYDDYASRVDSMVTVIILPQSFISSYDTLDDRGDSIGVGPGSARNFAWTHSIENGFTHHWVLDDNMGSFFRLNRNKKVTVDTSSTFAAAEDFVLRYKNIKIAGMNYAMFCVANSAMPPYVTNTRIYSCLFIDNSCTHRWRGRYNEDTILSLDVLKDGDCTVQFNAFLCDKQTTQTMGGGNTEEFYAKEGTLNKSKMLEDVHPDVSKVVYKFHRWHHHVDYSGFKQKLKLLDNVAINPGNNEYGMVFVDKGITSNE